MTTRRMRAAIGQLKSGNQQYLALYADPEDTSLVAKLYPSPDGTRLRLVLPELVNFAQIRIDTESHYIDFERDGQAAQRGVKR